MLEHVIAWLIKELQDPAKASTGMLGSIATIVGIAIARALAERRRLNKAVQSIPATVCPMPEPKPDESTPVASTLQIWALEDKVRELRGRLAGVDAQRQASEAEQERTAIALVKSRDRENALERELAELRRAIDSGHTRMPLPQSHVALRSINVTEADDRKTPPQGMTRVRR